MAIIEDSRLNRLGSLKCSVDIWELAIIPALLNNGGTWEVLDKRVKKELDDIQLFFLRQILAVPKSVPKPALIYESNLMKMKYRLFGRQINLVKHIFSHDEENLSKQILTEQLKNDWPGISKSAVAISDELSLEGLYDNKVTKTPLKG